MVPTKGGIKPAFRPCEPEKQNLRQRCGNGSIEDDDSGIKTIYSAGWKEAPEPINNCITNRAQDSVQGRAELHGLTQNSVRVIIGQISAVLRGVAVK